MTAPDLAIFTEEGWVVENVGVPPDMEVERDPGEVAAGKDPQLDRAIEVVLEALAKNPPAKGSSAASVADPGTAQTPTCAASESNVPCALLCPGSAGRPS